MTEHDTLDSGRPPVTGETRLQADWLRDPGVVRVIAALADGGAEARFVGGCVRNALLQAPVEDLDLAVGVPPQQTTKILKAAGIKVVPTGFEHGTVTAVVEDAGHEKHEALEITSLRRDVSTDGRRAVVSFTDDWAEDAQRRDFTMNALYADGEGRIHDPLGEGLVDLQARRVRFIGRAEDRIREDFLRILRFFRFAAWYGQGALDREGLEACERLRDGLKRLPHERIGQEMKKLLQARDPSPTLEAMAATGILGAALPEARAALLAPLIAVEASHGVAPDWPRRLASLFGAPRETRAALAARLDVDRLTDALRLSRAQANHMDQIRQALTLPSAEAAWRFGVDRAEDALLLAEALGEPSADREPVRRAAAAVFPLKANEVIAAGVAPGPGVGLALKRAEQAWLDSGFTAEKPALLEIALEATASD